MKQKFKALLKYFYAALAWLLPMAAYAQTNRVQSGLSNSNFQQLFGSGGLTSSQDLTGLIVNVIKILLFFAGAVAVVFVIIGGYYYLTAQGNEEQAEQGKKTLINAIIGVVVVILSYVIINVIVNLVTGASGVGLY